MIITITKRNCHRYSCETCLSLVLFGSTLAEGDCMRSLLNEVKDLAILLSGTFAAPRIKHIPLQQMMYLLKGGEQ